MQNPTRLRIANPPLFAVILCLAAASASFGQFESATVLGTATDPAAGAVPHARITLANLDTGTSQSTNTHGFDPAGAGR